MFKLISKRYPSKTTIAFFWNLNRAVFGTCAHFALDGKIPVFVDQIGALEAWELLDPEVACFS